MKLFGLKMDDLVKVEESRGVKVHENDFLLDPEKLLPPPHIRGRVTEVWIEGDRVVQRFGEQKAGEKSWGPAGHPNYMYFQGGELRFGKLTMSDTDLDLIDKDPRDPFDFDLDRYNDMLVAGYSKNTSARGLRTFMPDFEDLPQGGGAPTRQ
jgi:hypothetical protein